MTFQLDPSGQLVNLLVFLRESRIPFVPPPPEDLAKALLAEIDHPFLSPDLLNSLNLLSTVQHIPVTEKTRGFLNLFNTMNTLPPGNVLRLCTRSFKTLCGSENLTFHGMITRDHAMALVNKYIERTALRDHLLVHLDDTLKMALNTEKTHVTTHTLLELVEAVFT